jgi:hypothetical protein
VVIETRRASSIDISEFNFHGVICGLVPAGDLTDSCVGKKAPLCGCVNWCGLRLKGRLRRFTTRMSIRRIASTRIMCRLALPLNTATSPEIIDFIVDL